MPHLPSSPASAKLTIAETMIDVLEGDRDQALIEHGAADIGRLELALEDIGWQRLIARASTEFSRQGLEKIAVLSRLMWRKNPLIRRGVNVRTYYTWAQGVTIKGRDEAVNEIVQQVYSHPANVRAVFGQDSREELDRTLATDGNICFVLPTSPATGDVQVRTLPWTEIVDKISNPDDRADVWYWKRRYQGPDGTQVEQLHPDIDHQPNGVRRSQVKVGDKTLPVMWSQPVLMVAVDRLSGDTWGTPEVYAALDWARAYKEFLEDWASYVKALARWAWKHKVGSKDAAKRARTVHETGRTSARTGEQDPAGKTAVGTDVDGLEPVKQAGAHVDAESGRYLAVMVAAAFDMPYTILTGDADKSNLATAQTLDRPFELALHARRRRWADVYRRIFDHAIDSAVRAPSGGLSGSVSRDEWGRTSVALPESVDRTVDIDWPPLVEHDLKDLAEAVKFATEAAPEMPAEVTVRLLLTAFGVDDVDDVVEEAMQAAADAATVQQAEEAAGSVVARVLEAELGREDAA